MTSAEQQETELTTEQAFILGRMVRLAPKIRNNKQLRQIIRDIDASQRKALYDLLKPHLSFKPLPYGLMNI
jgi:hypothetical protein